MTTPSWPACSSIASGSTTSESASWPPRITSGKKGSPPSHPELLDWLAVDLVEHGWKLKRLHRLIMTSSVYRQRSERSTGSVPSRAEVVDPANELLGRMPLRRLEAEALRDAVLAASRRLNRRIGGPPTPLDSRADGLVLVSAKDPAAAARRSLYIFARRNYSAGLLDVFDFPIMALNCTRRPTTATPLQSLAALNSEFVQDEAAKFAERVRRETAPRADHAAWVERAFLVSLRAARAGRTTVLHEVARRAGEGIRGPASQRRSRPRSVHSRAFATCCSARMNFSTSIEREYFEPPGGSNEVARFGD